MSKLGLLMICFFFVLMNVEIVDPGFDSLVLKKKKSNSCVSIVNIEKTKFSQTSVHEFNLFLKVVRKPKCL